MVLHIRSKDISETTFARCLVKQVVNYTEYPSTQRSFRRAYQNVIIRYTFNQRRL